MSFFIDHKTFIFPLFEIVIRFKFCNDTWQKVREKNGNETSCKKCNYDEDIFLRQ